MALPRGKLIIFEGLDRAGKSTQVERLLTSLTKDGHKVEKLRFPGQPVILLQILADS